MQLLSLFSLAATSWALSFGLLDISFSGGNSVANRVIKTGEQTYEVVSEAQKLEYKRDGVKFIDVTNHVPVQQLVNDGVVSSAGHVTFFNILSKQLSYLKQTVHEYNYPKSVSQGDTITSLIRSIDLDLVKLNLANFTSFYTRYYKSASGLESAEWLHAKILTLVKDVPGVLVLKVKHKGWDQFSIVVSIPGKSEDKVVVGAHQDSINLLFPNLLRAPGADDDGSGTVTTLEALRLISGAISAGDFKPHNTLEFHYYSAEEGGLLGSIDVFSTYLAQNETVVGMLQQDMTGYTQGSIDKGIEPHFGLITDYTTAKQNEFIKLVVDAYCAIPVHETKCGYACSDHASALENGFPASFLIESEFDYSSKFIHLTMDTMDRLDFQHIGEHIKLTVAYAIELSAAKDLHN